jgi:hypothetical protein
MIRSKEQYEAACTELKILSEKDRSVGLNAADRTRFEALAEQVGRYEEDPAIFHRQRYSDTRTPLHPDYFNDVTGHEHSAR